METSELPFGRFVLNDFSLDSGGGSILVVKNMCPVGEEVHPRRFVH